MPIVSLTGTFGGNVPGSFINLEMNACSSSGFIARFVLGNGVVGVGEGKGNEIGVITLIGGGVVYSSFLRNAVL